MKATAPRKWALISETFKQAPTLPQASSSTSVHPPEQRTVDTENSGVSSQDATLLEIQEKTKETRDQKPVKSEKQKRDRRAPQRGIPMREEFFAKIGWTRSFISGPADPCTIPSWSGAICARKIFPSKQKEHLRYFVTTAQKGTSDAISGGDTST